VLRLRFGIRDRRLFVFSTHAARIASLPALRWLFTRQRKMRERFFLIDRRWLPRRLGEGESGPGKDSHELDGRLELAVDLPLPGHAGPGEA
jgi:hypothetical protein